MFAMDFPVQWPKESRMLWKFMLEQQLLGPEHPSGEAVLSLC